MLATMILALDPCASAPPMHAAWMSYHGGPRSVGGIGDVNGDRRADLIFGHARGGLRGVVYVVSGADAKLLAIASAPESCGAFGLSVAPWIDYDDDGTRDFAVGAPGTLAIEDRNTDVKGVVCVCSGKTGAILARFENGRAGDRFGYELTAAGDVDRDGKEDLLVGAPGIGKALVLSGKDGSELLVVGDGDPNGWYGSAVAAIGDVDDDAFPDLAIGAPLANVSGTVDVVSGKDGHLLRRLEAGNLATPRDAKSHYAYRTRFGCALSAAGDLDADGHPDLLVGADYARTEGRARVFCVSSGKVLREFRGTEGIFSRFATSLHLLGDVDADGAPDYVIADSDDDLDGLGSPPHRGQSPGSVFVFSGKTGGVLRRVVGDKEHDCLGYSVAACGDVDADGVPDFAAEAQWLGFVRYFRVYSGKNGAKLLQFDPPAAKTNDSK